jgi:hypothetical protein
MTLPIIPQNQLYNHSPQIIQFIFFQKLKKSTLSARFKKYKAAIILLNTLIIIYILFEKKKKKYLKNNL